MDLRVNRLKLAGSKRLISNPVKGSILLSRNVRTTRSNDEEGSFETNV